MDFQKVGAVTPLKRSALAERSDDELMQIASAGDLPTERLLRLYRADPGLQVGFDVAPVDGGATVGLSGRY